MLRRGRERKKKESKLLIYLKPRASSKQRCSLPFAHLLMNSYSILELKRSRMDAERGCAQGMKIQGAAKIMKNSLAKLKAVGNDVLGLLKWAWENGVYQKLRLSGETRRSRGCIVHPCTTSFATLAVSVFLLRPSLRLFPPIDRDTSLPPVKPVESGHLLGFSVD